MIINNPKYNSLPEQVEQNRKDIEEIKSSHLIDVDDELSTQSTNAVQNKVITEALDTEEFERKQADQDLEDADTTLQGNIDSEALARQQADQNLQNQLTPSQYINATTHVSHGSGSCFYATIGKLVLVYIPYCQYENTLPVDSSYAIFSDLPTPNTSEKEFIFYLNTVDSGDVPMRVKLYSNGEIKPHYTGFAPNKSYSGFFAYIKA